jgi:hypothetical protein
MCPGPDERGSVATSAGLSPAGLPEMITAYPYKASTFQILHLIGVTFIAGRHPLFSPNQFDDVNGQR